MAEAICKNCGVGINFIMLRDGFAWCHSLGSTECWNADRTKAEPQPRTEDSND